MATSPVDIADILILLSRKTKAGSTLLNKVPKPANLTHSSLASNGSDSDETEHLWKPSGTPTKSFLLRTDKDKVAISKGCLSPGCCDDINLSSCLESPSGIREPKTTNFAASLHVVEGLIRPIAARACKKMRKIAAKHLTAPTVLVGRRYTPPVKGKPTPTQATPPAKARNFNPRTRSQGHKIAELLTRVRHGGERQTSQDIRKPLNLLCAALHARSRVSSPRGIPTETAQISNFATKSSSSAPFSSLFEQAWVTRAKPVRQRSNSVRASPVSWCHPPRKRLRSSHHKGVASPMVQLPMQGLQRCNCSKTRCLKRYCECFRAGRVCSEVCNCVDCRNTENGANKVLRNRAMAQILRRNPRAFANSLVVVQSCQCVKSKCLKRYCVCYAQGLSCGAHCKCIKPSCANMGPGVAVFERSSALLQKKWVPCRSSMSMSDEKESATIREKDEK